MRENTTRDPPRVVLNGETEKKLLAFNVCVFSFYKRFLCMNFDENRENHGIS